MLQSDCFIKTMSKWQISVRDIDLLTFHDSWIDMRQRVWVWTEIIDGMNQYHCISIPSTRSMPISFPRRHGKNLTPIPTYKRVTK